MSYRDEIAQSLQAYLKTQASTLDDAKTWLCRWADVYQQVLADGPQKGQLYSVRAMSGHLSLALDPQDDLTITSSFQTRYGPELYAHWEAYLAQAVPTTRELYDNALALRQYVDQSAPDACVLGHLRAADIDAILKDYLKLRLQAEISEQALSRPVEWNRADPMESGKGELCAPMTNGKDQDVSFLLVFEDHDRANRVLTGRNEAREVFAKCELLGWNCHLFEQMKRNS